MKKIQKAIYGIALWILSPIIYAVAWFQVARRAKMVSNELEIWKDKAEQLKFNLLVISLPPKAQSKMYMLVIMVGRLRIRR